MADKPLRVQFSDEENGHWRESDMGREVMTGYLNLSVVNPLSAITVAALEDMGYVVDISKADTYTVSPTLRIGPPDRLFRLNELPVPPPDAALVLPRQHLFPCMPVSDLQMPGTPRAELRLACDISFRVGGRADSIRPGPPFSGTTGSAPRRNAERGRLR